MTDLRTFLTLVCGNEPWIEIRAVPEPRGADDARSIPMFFPGPGQAAAWALTSGRRTNLTHGIFFGVNARSTRPEHSWQAGKDDHVTAARVAWADLDWKAYVGGKDEATSLLRAIEPKPSAVVGSGGGFHAYWFLNAPLTPADSRVLNRRIVAALRSDRAVCNPSRIMRLPGSTHRKNPENLRPVKLLACHADRRYDLTAFDPLPKVDVRPPVPVAPPPPEGWAPLGREARYASRVLVCICERLSGLASEKHHCLFREAISIGRFVGTGVLDREEAVRWLLYAIERAGAEDLKGAEQTIRDGMVRGEREIPIFPWNKEAS